MSQQPQFSKVRNFFWPIASYELKKFIPMVLLIFLITCNYNILKIAKDTTIIPSVGVEVIPFIKVWLLLPIAVLMTAFFSYMVHLFNETKAFYIVISTFLAFFVLFIFVLFPNKEFFYLDTLANYLQTILPAGAAGFTSLVRYWHLCLFYTMCEIWGTTVLFVLFWGFANRVTALGEAKRFYALFGLAGNSSGIFAPLYFTWASTTTQFESLMPNNQWEKTLFLVFSGIFLSGALTLGIYYYVNSLFLKDDNSLLAQNIAANKLVKKKERKPFWQSFMLIVKQPYIRNITILVLSYNFVINLTEILWKAQVRKLYPSQVEYGLYFSKVMFITGIIATFSDLLVSSNLIRRFGWTVAAIITPLILLITSIGFFGFFFFDSYLEASLVHLVGLSPLAISVFFGSAQNALSRAAKYSLFDTTKEISFIPLDPQSRIQSKAAIDGVCSRLGKSSGSIAYQLFFLICGSLSACVPYVAVMLAAILLVWISAIFDLGKKFTSLSQKQEARAAEESQATADLTGSTVLG